MRDKSQAREFSHKPPSNITADGMDAWFYQQKQREKELRERRREAEELLRGYRGGRESLGGLSTQACPRDSLVIDGMTHSRITVDTTGFPSSDHNPPSLRASTSASESLDDPRSFHYKQRRFMGGNALRVPTSDEIKKSARGVDTIRDNLENQSEEGSVEVTVWLNFIEPGGKFPPEAGRYHLYLSYACPGSHRALIVRALKGLEDVIAVTYVHPTWRLTNPEDPNDKHRGWVFGNPDGEPFSNTIQRGGPFPPSYTDTHPDPLFDAYSIREIYELAGDTSGKFTVPLLWDTVHNTIVNNESSDIAYILNSCFNDFCLNPDLDLYTEYDEEGVTKLNEVSEWLSPLMIHGVYRCGFAKNQRAYDKAIAELCEAFDRADDILQKQRYLTGSDILTDADIRLCKYIRVPNILRPVRGYVSNIH